eukprot:1891942-Alexandrium_andersonii.AAC.1
MSATPADQPARHALHEGLRPYACAAFRLSEALERRGLRERHRGRAAGRGQGWSTRARACM